MGASGMIAMCIILRNLERHKDSQMDIAAAAAVLLLANLT